MCDNRNLKYVACPYTQGTSNLSKEDAEALKKSRHLQATKAASQLFCKGIISYSPLTCGFPMEQEMSEEHVEDYDAWIQMCLTILEHCDEVYVLCLQGWSKSKGVKIEVAYAKANKLKISYINFDAEGNLMFLDKKPKE